MAWHPFCPRCFRFFPGNAISDYKSPKGDLGCCPYCGSVLKFLDEDHPPARPDARPI
jgi:hypothetical protein